MSSDFEKLTILKAGYKELFINNGIAQLKIAPAHFKGLDAIIGTDVR